MKEFVTYQGKEYTIFRKQWNQCSDIAPLKEDRKYWRQVDKAHKIDLEAKELWIDQYKMVEDFKPEATLALQAYLKMMDNLGPKKPPRKRPQHNKPVPKSVQVTIEGAAPVITSENGITEVKFARFPGWPAIGILKENKFKWYPKAKAWRGSEASISTQLKGV